MRINWMNALVYAIGVLMGYLSGYCIAKDRKNHQKSKEE